MNPSNDRAPLFSGIRLLAALAVAAGAAGSILINAGAPTPLRLLARDPASPYRWSDAADSLAAAGRLAEARYSYQRAVSLGPNIPPVQMRAANFYLLNGDRPRALAGVRRVLALTPAFDEAVFSTFSRLEVPPALVLSDGLPAARRPELAADYAGFLLRAGRPEDAAAVWGGAFPGRRPAHDLVFNGGFEFEPLRGPLDWSLQAPEHVRLARDPAARSGKWSLRVAFDGGRNVLDLGISETLIVADPGPRRFRAFLRAEGITTAEGPRFRIFDAESPARLDVYTDQVTGSCGWREVSARVVAPPGTRLIAIALVRRAPARFDNRIRGQVWVDDVSLMRGP